MKSLTATSNFFFLEIQLKKEKLVLFWVPKFGCPNQYTSLPISLDTSLKGKLAVPYLEQITSGKQVGTQIETGKNFQHHEITVEDSIYWKQVKMKEK